MTPTPDPFTPTADANAALSAEEETTGTRVIASRFKSVFPMAEIPEADGRPTSMGGVVGGADVLVDLYKVIDRVADTSCTVLITGESGTGKELLARAVHAASPRRNRPFVAVNCGAIPEALLESELFGHTRGAFTGAVANKLGRVAQAEGGTLFLDEIGELPLALQVKLLRILQAREYSPVGDTRTLTADVRIVAATNIDLEEASRNGTFRDDLYYRLNVIHLAAPPLRDRAEDIPMLAGYFLERARARAGRDKVTKISRQAAEMLCSYGWPGNVRELENTIERAVLLSGSEVIEPRDLPAKLQGFGTEPRTGPRLGDQGVDLRKAVETFENHLIRQALERTNWNKKRAAELLGINRTTLVEMLKRKRIDAA
jgi:transcriptional regulator with PAS, ATPase and Fis domain